MRLQIYVRSFRFDGVVVVAFLDYQIVIPVCLAFLLTACNVCDFSVYLLFEVGEILLTEQTKKRVLIADLGVAASVGVQFCFLESVFLAYCLAREVVDAAAERCSSGSVQPLAVVDAAALISSHWSPAQAAAAGR